MPSAQRAPPSLCPNQQPERPSRMSDPLKNSCVLVIGGSSGIGLATAAAAVQAGATVTIASRSQAKLEAAAGLLAGEVRTARLDTADAVAVEQVFAEAEAWDHVVVSAAQTPSGP